MNKLIKKSELIALYAEAFDTSKKDAKEKLEIFFDVLADVIITQQKGIRLGDIGVVNVDVVPTRTFRNPQNGKKVVKETHYGLKFKTSKGFKNELATVSVE